MKVKKVFAIAFVYLCATSHSPVVHAGNSIKMDGLSPMRKGLLLASKKYPEEAVAEFKKCANFAGASPLELRTIAQAYFEVGEVTESLKIIDNAMAQEKVKKDIGQLAWLLELKGNIYCCQNKINQAVDCYKEAAHKLPSMAHMFLGKAGELLKNCKRFSEALPLLQASISPTRMNGFVYQNIGRCYLELKEPQKAVPALELSIQSFDKFRTNGSEAFLPGLIDSHKYLIEALEKTANKKEALIRKKRLDKLVGDVNADFFGDR